MSTSPDIQQLVNLTIFDLDPADLYAKALANANTLFPGWIPRAGNQEVAVLQAEAVIAAEVLYAINRLPPAILQGLLGLYGIPRSPGTPPSASVTFTLSDAAGHTLPKGAQVRLLLSEGRYSDFRTNMDLPVAAGQRTGTVGATAALPTSIANGVPAGTPLSVIQTGGAYVDSAALGSPVIGGVDPEDTASWLTRAVQVLGRLSSVLVTPTQFAVAAVGYDPAIFRVKAIDNWDPGGTGPLPGDPAYGYGGPAEGHITVAVYGQGDVPVTGTLKTALQAFLSGQTQVNLAVHVTDAAVTAVDVTCSVQRTADASSAAVQSDVAAALQSYLSTDSWMWGGTVHWYELIKVIEDVSGVDFLVSLDNPSGDVQLAGVAALAQHGTITVTVVDPA